MISEYVLPHILEEHQEHSEVKDALDFIDAFIRRKQFDEPKTVSVTVDYIGLKEPPRYEVSAIWGHTEDVDEFHVHENCELRVLIDTKDSVFSYSFDSSEHGGDPTILRMLQGMEGGEDPFDI